MTIQTNLFHYSPSNFNAHPPCGGSLPLVFQGTHAVEKVRPLAVQILESPNASNMPAKRAADFAFQQLHRNPYPFFLTSDHLAHDFPDLASHGLQDLSLCACPRLVASSRMFLEERALELLNRSHRKRSLLTIVSVGPGRCYQELVYLAKCVNAGYKRIQLVLIDLKRHAQTSSFRAELA